VLMLLGDTRYRKHIILGGGVAIVLSLLAIASASSFAMVLVGMMVGFPASGAFVSLSQGTLMELNHGREAHMMARWSLSGSIANLIGPLILAAGFAMGLGWRWIFYALALLCLALVLATWKKEIPMKREGDGARLGQEVKRLLAGLWGGVHNRALLRWMVLLQFSDLLLDVLTGYLALYFTDVMDFTVVQASLMMSVLMLAGLVSNIVLIPLLERFPGRNLVRVSAVVTGILYAAWLLAPLLWAKVALIILIKLTTLGWYEVLDGETFAAVPGRSGTVMAIGSIFGLLGGGMAFFIGWVAAQAGLPAAMWMLLAGPVILVLFMPRAKTRGGEG
jgi:MFS transporter, FSR family, fosmidomycin resistance protein